MWPFSFCCVTSALAFLMISEGWWAGGELCSVDSPSWYRIPSQSGFYRLIRWVCGSPDPQGLRPGGPWKSTTTLESFVGITLQEWSAVSPVPLIVGNWSWYVLMRHFYIQTMSEYLRDCVSKAVALSPWLQSEWIKVSIFLMKSILSKELSGL